MEYPSIEITVTLALHWTDRVKKLSLAAARAVHAQENEFRFYTSAAKALFDLYQKMTATDTGADYLSTRDEIAGKLAWPVECMIYRLQQIRENVIGARLAEVNQMVSCLEEVSRYLLPLAVPVTEVRLGPTRKRKPLRIFSWSPSEILAFRFILKIKSFLK